MDLGSIWESLNDRCWPLLDALHISNVFEDNNIPPIVFPLGIVMLILILLFAFSGGGAPPGGPFCGDGNCDDNETAADCRADCSPPEPEGKDVKVKLNKAPSCDLTITLYSSSNALISSQHSSTATEFTFTAIDETSVYAEITGKAGSNPQKTSTQTLRVEVTTIQVTLSNDLCAEAAPPKGTLRLTVKETGTNAPLNGVSISIAETQNGRTLAPNKVNNQLVNSQQDFSLDSGKTYVVFAQKENYNAYDGSAEPVTISAGSPTSKTITLESAVEQKGDLEVCVRNGTQPLLSGNVNIQDISGQFMQTGDVSEADPASEPSGSGCYVFKQIPSGKVLTVSMSSPPAGCVPVSSPTVTIDTAMRQMVYLDLNCVAGNVGYLKVKVMANSTPITQNATITVWIEDGSLIPGTGIGGSLALGTGNYSEEVTVPAGTPLYVWARGLPDGYSDYKSGDITVTSNQHRAISLAVGTSSPPISGQANFSFNGFSTPRIVSKNQSFLATINTIKYGSTELNADNSAVNASIGGYECAVYYDTTWGINCTSPPAPGNYDLMVTATYSGKSGNYKAPISVVAYQSGSGIITITPVFTTHGTPPLTLYYEIKFNGTLVSSLSSSNLKATYMDSPNAYPGEMQGLNQSDTYWKAVADVPYKGDYQADLFVEVLNNNVYYNTTYTVGFTASEHSSKLAADIYLSKEILVPSDRFATEVVLMFGNKIAYGLDIFDAFMDSVYYTLEWDDSKKVYSVAMSAPAYEICTMKIRFLINDEELSDTEQEAHVIDTSKQMSATCPLDSQGTCDSIGDARACVNNAKTGVAPYQNDLIVTCIKSSCPFVTAQYCNSSNKGDIEPDCVLDDTDENKASQILTTIQSSTERNEFTECLDMNNDGSVTNEDLTCLQKVVSGAWYGDTQGNAGADGSCTAPMNGGFCFDIDTDGVLPGDIYEPADGNINQDDVDVMEGIIAAIQAGVTPAQDILDVADFNQDGTINSFDLNCLKGFMVADFTTGYTLEGSENVIDPACINIFGLNCKGTEGDLNGDGDVSEFDFAIVNLVETGQLAISDTVKECADINDDGVVDESDVECMESFFTGDQETWLICLDCEENMPEEAYGDEICNDGYDNNCDGLKDKDDPICDCGEETPCDTKYDSDGGATPGVDDENYKLCRKMSGTSSAVIGEDDWQWYDQADTECTTETQCDVMSCEDKTYKCSSDEGGDSGEWFDVPDYCCFRANDYYFKDNFTWSSDASAPYAADSIWTVCVEISESDCAVLLSGVAYNTYMYPKLTALGLSPHWDTSNSGDLIFLPQGSCEHHRSRASDNYYLPVEGYGKSWGEHCGDDWDNDCYNGDCTCSS